MKVGDLVAWEYVPHKLADVETDFGIIIKMSRTGHTTESAQVRFMNGEIEWFDTQRLVLVNESS
jgi:hypothetical protein